MKTFQIVSNQSDETIETIGEEELDFLLNEAKIETILNCAEADLYNFIVDYLDDDPEESEAPAAQTWREIREILGKQS